MYVVIILVIVIIAVVCCYMVPPQSEYESRIRSFDPYMYYRGRPKLPMKNAGIPPIMFKTGPCEYENLPERIKQIHFQTIRKNKWMNIMYLSDHNALDFLRANFDDRVVMAFRRLKAGAFQADLLRYCLLYKLGGIYGDLSQSYPIPLRHVIDTDRDALVLVCDLPYEGRVGVQIAFMAASPNHPIFKVAIDMVVEMIEGMDYGSHVLDVTGPHLFRRALERLRSISDVEFRMELCQANPYFYANFKRPDKPVIITKDKSHTDIIRNETHYSVLYAKRDVFHRVVPRDQSSVCTANVGTDVREFMRRTHEIK